MSATIKRTKERIDWVDYAKGITIILVVLLHTNYENLYSEPFVYTNSLLAQMRMPFFFFISGLFIHKSMKNDISSFMKGKILPLLYLFVLWSVIRYLVDSVPRKLLMGQDANLDNLFMIFIDPTGTYWYIYALLIYLLVTWIFSSIPRLTMFFSLIFFAITIQVGESNFLMKLTVYYPLFLFGYLSSKFVLSKAGKVKLYHLIVPVLYFVILASVKETPVASNPLGVFIINCGGIVSGIIVSVLLSKIKSFSWLTTVGKNTLPIYVLHFVPLGALKIILPSIIPNQPELAVILMLVSGVAFPLFVVKMSNKLGMEWLFTMPNSLVNKNRKLTPN